MPSNQMAAAYQICSHGLFVVCDNANHFDCNKYRNCKLDISVFGEQAATFYLEAWLLRSRDMSPKAHKRYRPNRQVVREVYEKNP